MIDSFLYLQYPEISLSGCHNCRLWTTCNLCRSGNPREIPLLYPFAKAILPYRIFRRCGIFPIREKNLRRCKHLQSVNCHYQTKLPILISFGCGFSMLHRMPTRNSKGCCFLSVCQMLLKMLNLMSMPELLFLFQADGFLSALMMIKMRQLLMKWLNFLISQFLALVTQ